MMSFTPHAQEACAYSETNEWTFMKFGKG